MILPFCTNRTRTSFMAYSTNNLRAPLFMGKPLYSLLFHRAAKLNQLRLKLMTLICSTLSITSYLSSRSRTSLGYVSVQLSAYRRWMNSNFMRNLFLSHYCLNKGLNLIPLYQTELSVIFCHSNQKVALLGQMAKCHQKHSVVCFEKLH